MHFYKYHGLGNDYLVYDCNKEEQDLTKELIQKICHRNTGIGSDGILYGPIMQDGIPEVKIYNPDGSEAEKSGNGVRIFSKYLKDAGYMDADHFRLKTLGGDVTVDYRNKEGTSMTVSMGRLSFQRDEVGAIKELPEELVNIPLQFGDTSHVATCVSIGNPHCVMIEPEISKEKVCEIGKYSEKATYFPNRINTQIVKILDIHNIQIEIFERGVGYTLASGTSSCAAAGVAYRLGLVASPVTVQMPGGTLKIEIDQNYNVKMTGEVSYIGDMVFSIHHKFPII